MLSRNLVLVIVLGLGGLGVWNCLSPRNTGPLGRGQGSDRLPAGDLGPVVARIDQELQQQWQSLQLTPAPRSDDLTIARRTALALVGSIPSTEELQQLRQLPAGTRIDHYVDYLLRDRRHADFLAEHLADAFVGTEGGPFLIFRRRRFVNWLSDRLHANQPYDQIVREMITAEGLWTTNPAVNFLTVNADDQQDNRPDPVRMAGRTARAFLAVRLDCVECHDDRLDGEWRQSDFHELAAYYSDVTATFAGIRDITRPYRYRYLTDEEESLVAPHPPFHDLPPSADASPRLQLAAWVTDPDNRAFGRAIVNRAWALAFGRPLVVPLDDIPLAGPHPPVLELLVDDLQAHQFDLRRLWRVMTRLSVFHLDSRADFPLTELHEQQWAVFPVTRLRPTQVAGALFQSSQLKTVNAQSHILLRAARAGRVHEFVQAFGGAPDDSQTSFGSGTVPQRLVMLNGQSVGEATRSDLIFNGITRIARLAADDEQRLTMAYLALLTRPPSAVERDHFMKRMRGLDGAQRESLFSDLQWTLVNSAEFSWNH